MVSRRFLALVLAPAALVLAASMMTRSVDAATEKCPDGGIKFDNGEREYCSKDGIITSVCIKAGNEVFSFTADSDGKEGCYSVKGIGTDCVVLGGGGTGRDCKEISGFTVYVDDKGGDDK